MTSSTSRALIALGLLVLVWAYSWIIMKQVLQHAAPIDFAALRYSGGAIVLFVVLLLRRDTLAPPPLLPTLLVGLAQTLGFQALAQWALVSGGAGKVALFCYTMPFWVVLLAWWWLNDIPGRRQWLGLTLAACGLLLVIAPWQDLNNWLSVSLAIGGGMAWAIGTVLSKRVFQQHAVSPLVFTAWQMLIGALALCALAWQLDAKPIDWNSEFLWQLAYSIFLASSLAWVLWSIIVRALPSSVAGLSSLLVPIGAILLAWLLLGDSPSTIELVGIAMIMAGLLVIRPRSAKST